MSTEKKRIYLPLAVIAAVLLVASVTTVPALNAFAQEPPETKPPSHPKPPAFVREQCPRDDGIYNKHCDD